LDVNRLTPVAAEVEFRVDAFDVYRDTPVAAEAVES
jgi:hypothetical protein